MKIHEYNEMMAYLTRPATGDRVKLAGGSGVIDYGKKYLKYKDRPTQEKLNRIIDDLTAGGAMTPDAALDIGLRQIREEIK